VTVFIICCIVVGGVWVRLVVRTRQRARMNIEEVREMQAQFDQAQRSIAQADTKRQARFAQYQREMSSRSMDRFNNLRALGPDPTFEQWLVAKGYREDAAS
jgi:hypothetical protein